MPLREGDRERFNSIRKEVYTTSERNHRKSKSRGGLIEIDERQVFWLIDKLYEYGNEPMPRILPENVNSDSLQVSSLLEAANVVKRVPRFHIHPDRYRLMIRITHEEVPITGGFKIQAQGAVIRLDLKHRPDEEVFVGRHFEMDLLRTLNRSFHSMITEALDKMANDLVVKVEEAIDKLELETERIDTNAVAG